MNRRMPVWTLLGFSLGVATMLAMKHFFESGEERNSNASKNSPSLVTAMGIDVALDVLFFSVGFAAG